MQTGKMELMSQQVVLAFLGYYNGAIDGIWSAASMKAKVAFECADNYVPGIPSNGLPFAVTDRLPKGLYWEKKLLNHRDMSAEQAAALIQKRTRQTPVTPPPVVEEPELEEELEDEEDYSDDDAQG